MVFSVHIRDFKNPVYKYYGSLFTHLQVLCLLRSVGDNFTKLCRCT